MLKGIVRSAPSIEEFEGMILRKLKGANPQGLEEVVRPDVLARWRRWGVPEPTIEAIIRQRIWVREQRRVEERITIPNFAYTMPRLPEIEKKPEVFAMAIDTDGWIESHGIYRKDRLPRRIDRWLYRYEGYQPVVGFSTETYELTERIANIMLMGYAPMRMPPPRPPMYRTRAFLSRAVRICYLIKPYLLVPEKSKEANEVLTIYKRKPTLISR